MIFIKLDDSIRTYVADRTVWLTRIDITGQQPYLVLDILQFINFTIKQLNLQLLGHPTTNCVPLHHQTLLFVLLIGRL